MYFWILLSVLSYLFYKFLYIKTQYWKERNIAYHPAFPILGSKTSNFWRRLALPNIVQEMYNDFPNAKYIGLHQFTFPVLMLKDPELIKNVTVKDFDHFTNHKIVLTEDYEPLFGKNLFSLKNQRWRNMRSTLSPAFTGSKMRIMYNLISDCSKQFVQYFLKEVDKSEGMVTVEMKDTFTRYANDVIATVAFGVTCDSLTNKENEFYTCGKTTLDFGKYGILKIIGYVLSPKLMNMLDVHLVSKKASTFFSNLITSTMKLREKEGIVRPDMIHLLMEARKGKLKHETVEQKDSSFAAVEESNIGQKENSFELTDEDIIAQAILFFFAGYETVSTMLGFMAYELAINPDVQKRLYEEIEELNTNGTLNYESILKLKYLDMVVSETLRKWPSAVMSERLCEKPYTIETEDGHSLTIEKDISVWIPSYAIHHDPKYFPNPEKFDPERFSDENKDNIQSFTYLPFGAGPRNCIGSRFALLEIKSLFAHFLSKFEFVVVEKTDIPLKLDGKKYTHMVTENGIWLGLKLRN